MTSLSPLPPTRPDAVPLETRSYEGAGPPEAVPNASVPSGLARGTTVHRYTILDRVGEGGMGIVYAAYDPSLDRRVALKFLRAHEADRHGVRERRLLREAQAMARLSHPNVAVVYEVGTFESQVFLAMEFVDGMDLRTWLAEKPRSSSDIAEVFRAAGRGLAAAHAAGIIHRDFKPENVLLDRQHRPRVTDFGLSRASQDLEEEVPESTADYDATPLSSPSQLSVSLTGTGGVLGTPSYMAPEQHLRGAVDARSDQFSFCVALYVALYGEHPFGEGGAERPGNAIAGRVSPPPAHSSVPRVYRQALLRGLAPSREGRYASMEALLAALVPPPTRRRRQIAIAAALGLILAGAGTYALVIERPAASPGPRCDLGVERLSGVWDLARRRQLQEAFEGAGASGADVTWTGFSAILDERARAWVAMHNEACAATHVHGLQSPAVLDLRMECLDRRRQEMKALVDVYSEKLEPSSLDRAVTAADKLSSVSACADVANLRAVIPLAGDPAVRARVQSIRQRLTHSRALYEAGRYKQGREFMLSLKQEADALEYAPLAAEAANALATHLSHGGDFKEAEKVLFDAARRAVEGRDWNQEAEAWLELVGNYGRDGRVPEGLLAARVAEMAVRRANGDESMQARLARNVAYATALTGNLQEELGHYHRAEELWKRSLGTRSPRYAYVLCDIGSTLMNLGRPREGLKHLERSLDLQRSILRPDHPDIADTLFGMAQAYIRLGKIQKAREIGQRSVDIRAQELGPENELTTRAREVVARTDTFLGNYARALKSLSHLLSIRKRVLHPNNILLAATYAKIGEAQSLAGFSHEAERTLLQAIEQEARAKTGENLISGFALTILGELHNRRRLGRQALIECRRALDILSRHLGPTSSRLLDTRTCLGEALIGAGDFKAARDVLEVGLASVGDDENPRSAAAARFQLARALWPTPADRPRARELARATLSALTAAEGDNRELLARIQKWVSTHGDPPGR
jgi:tetratricopeptide (TPR) repeat protein